MPFIPNTRLARLAPRVARAWRPSAADAFRTHDLRPIDWRRL